MEIRTEDSEEDEYFVGYYVFVFSQQEMSSPQPNGVNLAKPIAEKTINEYGKVISNKLTSVSSGSQRSFVSNIIKIFFIFFDSRGIDSFFFIFFPHNHQMSLWLIFTI